MRFFHACRLLASGALLALALPKVVSAACRTETCPISPSFSPYQAEDGGPYECSPDGPTCPGPNGTVYQNLPVYWQTACVGYSVQQDASVYVTLPDFEAAVAGAFATWTSATCGADPVGIAVHFLGPVECAAPAYDAAGPNHHEILFHDDTWPYDDAGSSSATVALTTVTYDIETGALVDSTIELNTADHVIVVADPPPPNGFDLQSVLTHETGHFLGMAHTPDENAVMYATRDLGVSGLLRSLTPDDVTGICSAYPGNGTRVVSPLVADGGILPEGSCDWSVVGGFASACAFPPTAPHQGCSIAIASVGSQGDQNRFPWGPAVVVLAGGGVIRKRKRRVTSRG